MAALFAQVLVLARGWGMGQLGLVALDGMKIAARASKDANRTEARLRELAGEIAAEHAATDAAEDELFGRGRAVMSCRRSWSPRTPGGADRRGAGGTGS